MPPPFRFQPRVEPLPDALSALALTELVPRLMHGAEQRDCVLLDGWPGGTSVLAFAPLRARLPRGPDGLRRFWTALEAHPGDPVPGAFQGGFLGALAYEFGARSVLGLTLPPDPWGLPPLVGGLYTDFLVRDEKRAETWLVLGEDPGDGRPSVDARRRTLLARLEKPRAPEPCIPSGPLQRRDSPEEHRRRIVRARELIAEGEIYQANLTYRSERDVAGDPFELYLRLRALHPAPWGGFLRWGGGALLSVSPELLLAYETDAQGPLARTQPIKGTAARGRNALEDRAAGERLLASAKDRSELAMIVDLERNDLGRIARPGGVRVDNFPMLASFASVHHLVADVVARPRAGVDALDCLRALFPGGSVTGAPKLRSMEAIAALEGEGRGFAYGSLLALDTRGHAWANLLIRTLIWRPRPGGRRGQVSYRVGGGITWGSEPAAEEAEARDKGLLLARALEGAGAGAGSVWQPGAANALL